MILLKNQLEELWEDIIKNNKSLFYCCNRENKKLYDGNEIIFDKYPWGKGKLIYEHKPPFRACDQSVFIDKDKEMVLLFNASNAIPNIFKDTRTFSLREWYMRFIHSIKENNELPTFKTDLQIKEIIEKIV